MWTVEVPPSGDPEENDGFLARFYSREAAVRKARLWASEDRGARFTLLDPHDVPEAFFVWENGMVQYHSLPRE